MPWRSERGGLINVPDVSLSYPVSSSRRLIPPVLPATACHGIISFGIAIVAQPPNPLPQPTTPARHCLRTTTSSPLPRLPAHRAHLRPHCVRLPAHCARLPAHHARLPAHRPLPRLPAHRAHLPLTARTSRSPRAPPAHRARLPPRPVALAPGSVPNLPLPPAASPPSRPPLTAAPRATPPLPAPALPHVNL
ncbi:hypothetical protein B0H13DRAFT_2357451 [Mycena leptocephala]|nr:hypothetical protein B0H13DRAFT_2357451 [Mycena leptocephala]